MIPKVIHYCWFGGAPLPMLAQKCIASWRKYCPDYEIVRWDESNFDMDYNSYVREAYKAKKWAFITDVVRLYALVNYGGVYMDTDVEVLKPIDRFLQCEAFSGFESDKNIPTGIMASEKGQELFVELLNQYGHASFLNEDGSYDLTTNVERITQTCTKYGFVPNNQMQIIKGFALYPKDYFCPKDLLTQKVNLTENSYTIHHFDGSWTCDEEKYFVKLKGKLLRIPLPVITLSYTAKFISVCKYRGLREAVHETVAVVQRRVKEKLKR